MGRRHEQTFLQRRHADGQEIHEKMFIMTTSEKCKSKLQDITSHLSEWLKLRTQETTGIGC